MRETSARCILDRVVRVNSLGGIYGGLLTEKQRLFVQLHFAEDLSFGEVAREFGISRQAVHDAVKHAERTLEDLESKLRLLSPKPMGESPNGDRKSQLRDGLQEIRRRVVREGVIYNVDWIVEQLDELIDVCKGNGRVEAAGGGET